MQVRHVRAGDQQQEANRAQEDEGVFLGHVADQELVKRDQRGAPVLVAVRVLLLEPQRDSLHLRAGLRLGYAGLQSSDREKHPGLALIAVLGCERERHPELGGHGEHKILRHDADHLEGAAVKLHGAAYDPGIGGEAAYPEPIAHDCHVVAPGLVLFGPEGAPEQRLDAQSVKEIGRNQEALHPLRIARRAGQVGVSPAVETHTLEHRVLTLPVQIGRRRDYIPLILMLVKLLENHGHAVDLRQGNRFPENRVGDAEDGRVDANPHGQGQGGNDREARILPQHAERVA